MNADQMSTEQARLTAKGVTLVVPVYDEEDGIEGVVRRLSVLELGAPLELLVIDDGSTDGTRAKLSQLEREVDCLRVIEHGYNRGYGAALKTGFREAAYEVVVITDADSTYPEDRIRDLLDCVDRGAEMAVGARTGESVHIPLVRRPAKWVLRKLASYLAGVRIPDLNSGLRAFRRELVETYVGILPDGFSFTTTITLASLTNHHQVEYVTIDYAHRSGSSKIRPIRDTLRFISLIIRTVLYFNPLRVFYPLFACLSLFLGASFYYDVFLDETAPNLSDKTVVLFLASVQVLSLGLVADLIDKKARLR
jgi:glycosyltransferase involved in cell wall biosynthesis